jgi:F-type H+-transporting ATPase subunit delta
MEELIAKKYIKALKSNSDIASMEDATTIFTALAESFKNEKFVAVVMNPNVNSKDKADILLDSVKSANSDKVNNLIKLLVENKRIEVIPAIAQELHKDMAHQTKTYTGVVSSDSEIQDSVLKELSSGLSKRFDSTISLQFVKNSFDGIKVEVEGLGVEINFSKERIKHQIIQHIIKAI